jgi:hypothetical protein
LLLLYILTDAKWNTFVTIFDKNNILNSVFISALIIKFTRKESGKAETFTSITLYMINEIHTTHTVHYLVQMDTTIYSTYSVIARQGLF